MEFLSEAMDNGATFHIHMAQFDNTGSPVEREKALRYAAMFKDAVGGDITEKTSEFCDSFIVDVDELRACFSHSPVEKAD
jgi:hypothetical protein